MMTPEAEAVIAAAVAWHAVRAEHALSEVCSAWNALQPDRSAIVELREAAAGLE